jgi:hypothetical protein
VSGESSIPPALIIGEQKNHVGTRIRLSIIPRIFGHAVARVQKNHKTADPQEPEVGPTDGELQKSWENWFAWHGEFPGLWLWGSEE